MTPEQGSIIQGGLNTVNQVSGAYAQMRLNKKMRDYNKDMYQTQRNNALADWNMQNEYNSPAAQMQRFKDAGLNPNLIYGQTNTADAVRSTDQASWQPKAPDAPQSNTMQDFMQVRMQQQTLDNLKAANVVQQQEAILKAVQSKNVEAQTAQTTFQTGRGQSLLASDLSAAEQNVRKLMADTQFTVDENARKGQQNTAHLSQVAEAISKSKTERATNLEERKRIQAATDILKNENVVKKFEAELARRGINPRSNLVERIATDIMMNPAEFIKRPFQHFKKFLDENVQSFKNNLEFNR